MTAEYTLDLEKNTNERADDEGRGAGTVTVHRLSGGGRQDAVCHVPLAFAFGASDPDAPIRHVE